MKYLLAFAALTLTATTMASDMRLPANSPLEHIKARHFDEAAALPSWSPKGKKLYMQVAGVHFNEY